MSSSQQDDREEILAAVRALPRIELAICGGLDSDGRYLPGVLDRLAQVEKRINALDQEKDRRAQKQWGVWVLVLGALLTTLVNVVREMVGKQP